MKLLILFVYTLSCAFPLSASPIAQPGGPPSKPDTLAVRAADVCSVVNTIVKALKPSEATPFCSSFLSIGTFLTTATITVPQTTIASVTITSTTTVTSTNLIGISRTDTVTNTASDISTITSFTTTTNTITPPITTITTTSYTTPAAAAKRSIALKERAVKVPPQLASLASSIVSTVCRCLSIPTPTSTTTKTVTTTQTVDASTVTTLTNLITVTATVTNTFTSVSTASVYTTLSTSISTTITTTVTTTLPQTTATSVVTLPLSSQCINLSSGTFYNGIDTKGRGSGQSTLFPIGSKGSPDADLSYCCQTCFDGPDCAFYTFKTFSDTGNSRCTIFINKDPIQNNTSLTCPNGRLDTGDVSGPRPTPGFALGPCYAVQYTVS